MISKNKIILDCTLRDGGYYNNWQFSKSLVREYILNIQELGVNVIELGFRFPKPHKRLGSCGKTSDKFINSFLDIKKSKFAVMINSSDYINKNVVDINLLSQYFKKKNLSGVDIVRIATHFKDLEKSNQISKFLKQIGYEVCLNLMQISDIDLKNLKKELLKLKEFYFDVFYFADSLGSLNTKDIQKIVLYLKKNLKVKLGIHAHDNQNLALSNTLTACEYGVDWLDSTFMGMGRGPGNAATEKLIIYRNKNKIGIDNLTLITSHLYDSYFKKLYDKYKWGPNYLYYLSSLYGIHPTYIQAMKNSMTQIEKTNLLLKLKELPEKNKFFSELLHVNQAKKINFYKNTNKKYYEFLIIGGGNSFTNNLKRVEKYIEVKKPCVLLLNYNDQLSSSYIDFILTINPMKMIEISKNRNLIKNTIIAPKNLFSKNILKDMKNIFYFNSKAKDSSQTGMDKANLVLSYAIHFASSLNSKQITFVGIDGYKNKKYDNSLIQSLIEEIPSGIIKKFLYSKIKVN